MTILLGLATAAALAGFGLVFLASAKAESWLALAIFAACAVGVLTLPLAGWLGSVASGWELGIVAGIGLAGGGLCLWALHRAGLTDRLAKVLAAKR